MKMHKTYLENLNGDGPIHVVVSFCIVTSPVVYFKKKLRGEETMHMATRIKHMLSFIYSHTSFFPEINKRATPLLADLPGRNDRQ